ncbi:MAG: DUF5107 domain-containing protein, partial [Lentisphaerae bacterium]|nr:DUF5107 domain-containing protein [Lentisphaerota bacterium]
MKKHEVTARRTPLSMPTYTREEARRLPNVFQEYIYPETRDDLLGGPKQDVTYDSIVLENEHLRVTVVPEFGGKLFSMYDKNAGQETLYVPDVIKPGLIGRCGAWIPGGIEFNFPIGHHIRSMRPQPCSILESGPERACVLVERRCARTGMRMEARIALAAGEARCTIDYAVYNPTALSHRWGFWANVGVHADENWRFLGKADSYLASHIVHPFPIDESGCDTSWYGNRDLG